MTASSTTTTATTRPKIVAKTKDGKITKQSGGRRYRSRMQIIAEILSAASQETGGLNQCRLMYRSFLSFAQTKDYFTNMVTDSLLEYNDQTKKFTVTDKGFTYLENYRKMIDLSPSIDLTDINQSRDLRNLHL